MSLRAAKSLLEGEGCPKCGATLIARKCGGCGLIVPLPMAVGTGTTTEDELTEKSGTYEGAMFDLGTSRDMRMFMLGVLMGGLGKEVVMAQSGDRFLFVSSDTLNRLRSAPGWEKQQQVLGGGKPGRYDFAVDEFEATSLKAV